MPTTKTVGVGMKLYINGFPKSGTHVLASMGEVLLRRKSAIHNWLGNISGYSFTANFVKNQSYVHGELDRFPPNSYTKGHMAYTPEIAQSLQNNKICAAFIFRDFRDVAVSATHHALAHKNNHFPEIEFYQSLEFDDVLRRVITGDGNIAGVMERWEMYAPWLDEGWVLKIAYEDYIEHPLEVAEMFLRYLYGRTAKYYGVGGLEIDRAEFDREMRILKAVVDHPEISCTYREGMTGGWRKHFTDEHKALFKASDTNNWLIKLGYENDRNW